MMIRPLIHPRDVVLERYRAGLLAESARNRVERHLAHCSRCRTLLEKQAALEKALAAHRTEVISEAFVDSLVATVLSEQASTRIEPVEQSVEPPNPHTAFILAIAALLVAVLLIFIPMVAAALGSAPTLVAAVKGALAWWRVGSSVAQALVLAIEPVRSIILACTVITLGWCFAMVTQRGTVDPWQRRSV